MADETAAPPPLEGPEATQAFLDGAHEIIPDADGRVRVVRNGQIGSVPGEQLESFLRTTPGARLASHGEVLERAKSREYGEGIGNELAAAGAAALRTASLGGSDVLLGELGGDKTRETLRELQARNPLADLTGTGIGIGATALATGGTGGLARALSATPAGLAMRAGVAVERAAGASTALGRAAALSAGGALEGTIFGVGEGASEWALNPDAQERTAERLMASMAQRAGKNALLGGLAAGGLSLTGSALGKGSKAALERIKGALGKGEAGAAGAGTSRGMRIGQNIDATATREGKTTLGQSLDQRGMASATDDLAVELELGGAKPIKGKGPLQDLADGATARQRFAQRQQRATTEISDDVSLMNSTADELFGRTGGVERKQTRARKLFEEDPPANLDVTNGETLARLEQLDDELADAATQVNLYEKRGLQGFKAIREDIGEIAGAMRMARGPEELAQNFRGLDRLKQRLGRVRNSLESGAGGDTAAAAIMNRHYENLRTFLEDDGIWGKAAAGMQRENNAALSSYLDYARSFDARFALERGHRTAKSTRDPFQRVAEADPQKVGSALSGLGKAESAKVEEVLIEGARRQADMLETLARNYDLSPADLAKVKAARSAANRIQKHADELKSLSVQGDRWDETIQRLSDMPWVGGQLAKLKVSTGRALSLAMEGRGASEAATTATERLGVSGTAHAEAIEGAAQRLTAMQRVYMASESVGQKLAQATERYARTIGSSTGRATRLTATSSDARADRKKRFDQAYASVREFERDPEAALNRVFRLQGSLGTIAPILANAYADKTVRAATFLAGKMPGRDPSAHLFGPQEDDVQPPPRVSDDEKREFLKYVDAVEEPLSLVEELEAGHVRPQTVEAVQAVYPKLYADIRDGVLESLDAAEVTPPYRARMNLGILFDLPTDAMLEPDMLRLMQASAVNAAGSPQEAQAQATLSPSQRSAPELAGQVESTSASLQNGL